MLLAIISAVVCIIAATIMYTPRLRGFQHYRPVALAFIFEGIWIMLDYIFRQIMPDNVFMEMIHYIGLIVLGIYFVVSVFFLSGKKTNTNKKNISGRD